MQENTKKIIIAAVIIIAVALVSTNVEKLTGNVPRADKVTFLSAEQLKDANGIQKPRIVVRLYPRGGAGGPGKWIDMREVGGTKHSDERTKCDDYGTKTGSSECDNFEVATFDIKGTTWKNGEVVQFNIRSDPEIKSSKLVIVRNEP